LKRYTLLRGRFKFAVILLFGLIVLNGSSRQTAAQGALLRAYVQYLPLLFTDTCVPRPYIPPNDPKKDLALEKEINKIRENFGLRTLKHSDKIAQAALRHSNDIAFNNISDHIGSDGSTPGDRLNDACYHWQVYGEIIAGSDSRGIDDVIVAWMNSPSHREIILEDIFTEFGGAYAYNKNRKYKYYYTVDFGVRYLNTQSIQRDYYACKYSWEDAEGVIWLNLYSVWPCEKLLPGLKNGA